MELAAQREADAELETLRTLAARLWDLVLGGANGPSSLVVSMSAVTELLEGRIDVAATNGVRWGPCFALVATVMHFLELEVLGSRHIVGLSEDEADALWT
jgi:hypothetical protein